MKVFRLFTFLLFAVFAVSCSSDDDDSNPMTDSISITNIPAEIESYLSQHFPNANVLYIEQENEDGVMTYEVDLSGNISLRFDQDYHVISIDGEGQLPNSVIPQSILDYVAINYPNNYIIEWDLEDNYQEIELDNGIELLFNLEGEFLSSEDSNDDDETLDESEIPAEISAFVNQYFPTNTIVSVVQDDDDEIIVYEVELSEDIDLEFNSAFEIISIESDTELPNSVIPDSILSYINLNYPNYYITEWALKNNYQQIELNNGIELNFDLEGNLLNSDEEDDSEDSNDGETILTGDLIPSEITSFVSQYFTNNTILEVVKDTDDGIITYEVDLTGDIDLEFNSALEIISIEADTELPNALIPTAILSYVSTNYPNNYIIGWELDDNHQQVELNNGLELNFDLEGIFLSTDD